MPRLTPTSTVSRTPPMTLAMGWPRSRATRSTKASSTPALAMGWPRKAAEARREVGQVLDLLAEDRGGQEVAYDVARRPHGLVAEEGGLPGHALAPSGMRARFEAQQEEEPRLHPPEADLEGLEQGQAHEAQLQGIQAQRGGGSHACNIRC